MNNRNQAITKDRSLGLINAIIARELSCSPADNGSEIPQSHCPRCESGSIAKRGHDSTGKQRYHCKSCGRSFTATTGNTLSSTNLSISTWLAFAECHINKRTLRESATMCSVSLQTAFYMKKRLKETIARYRQQVSKKLAAARMIARE